MRALMLLAVTCAAPALAWDGNALWQQASNAPYGGAGIWGTGGKQDFGVSCTHCHVRPASLPTPRVNLVFGFNPLPESVGGAQGYKPGTVYTVTATMTGETLGLSGCGQYDMHMNGFGAAFEFANGTRAGRYQTDTGQDSSSCQPTSPDSSATMNDTTITYGRCHAVVSTGSEGRTNWTFTWTAPPAGSGAVTVYWGVVDGNCDMTSLNDDAVGNKFVLVEGMAEAPARPRSPGRLRDEPRRWAAVVASGRRTRFG